MTYDRADWHYGGNYPEGLPDENGGTHIGMFLAWAILNGQAGALLKEHSPQYLDALRARRITGREVLFEACDGKFWSDDLSEEGNAFAQVYYAVKYLDDYSATLGDSHPTLYHIENSWENYDRIAPVITRRFELWKKSGSIEKPWWKVW